MIPDEDQEEYCACGNKLNYEEISSDADGNRKEFGYVCSECD